MLVNGDIKRRAVESGVITLAPFFEDPVGCAYDLTIIDGLLVAGVSLSRVWEETAALVSDPEYRRKVRVVESALWGHPYLARRRGRAADRCILKDFDLSRPPRPARAS